MPCDTDFDLMSSAVAKLSNICRSISVLALAAPLAACVVTTPVDITSTSGRLQPGNTIFLAPFEADGSQREVLGNALRSAFANSGLNEASDGTLVAEFAIAERSASLGEADPDASSEEEIVWTSANRRGRLLDACDARNLRATLVLLNRADGTLAYRGVAESVDCEFGASQIGEMADALVADAQGNFSPAN